MINKIKRGKWKKMNGSPGKRSDTRILSCLIGCYPNIMDYTGGRESDSIRIY